ncbi:hypothetical protein ACQ86N_43180 [Puia sp. P3]|uniref:anti-sigma factor family protein n=1 Tax=Puia sp. P3 TaxID=3423952 RepID=UPI003D66FFBD
MITRENYQEFFLLYVDNELSAADASALEEWVAANPDLMEEWESLQFCRVDPDEKVIFPGKEGLLRAGDDGIAGIGEDEVEGIGEDRVERIGEDRVAGIGEDGLLWEASPTSAGGYPGYLLSYIDGELGPAEREQAEARIAARASDAAELQQLLMTVSKPDISVIFPDKSSLYRKEKDRRVIELRRSVVPRPFPFVPFGPSVPSGILRAVAGAAAVILIAVPLLIKKPAHPVTPGGAVALQDKKAGGSSVKPIVRTPGWCVNRRYNVVRRRRMTLKSSRRFRTHVPCGKQACGRKQGRGGKHGCGGIRGCGRKQGCGGKQEYGGIRERNVNQGHNVNRRCSVTFRGGVKHPSHMNHGLRRASPRLRLRPIRQQKRNQPVWR